MIIVERQPVYKAVVVTTIQFKSYYYETLLMNFRTISEVFLHKDRHGLNVFPKWSK